MFCRSGSMRKRAKRKRRPKKPRKLANKSIVNSVSSYKFKTRWYWAFQRWYTIEKSLVLNVLCLKVREYEEESEEEEKAEKARTEAGPPGLNP